MPEVRKRQAHVAAFGFCRAWERREVLRRPLGIVIRFVQLRRRMLRRRVRLPLSERDLVGCAMRKSWLIFGAVQATGVLGGLTGLYLLQDGLVLILYSVFLLPGILFAFPFSPFGHARTHWPLWAIYSVAVFANGILFAAASAVFSKRRRPN
jgi:hypothetical protein